MDDSRVALDNDQLQKLEQRAKDMIEKDQKEVPQFWVKKYKNEASKNWDLFYKRNTTKFFKDRHWTDREFSEIARREGSNGMIKCLEIGCGVGNFAFPALEENPNLFIYACDFSSRAIDLFKGNESYKTERCKAFVCDITTETLLEEIPAESLDLVSAIFVFSAIPPEKMATAILNIYKVLKPGGIVMFRDYGLYDEAQLKFSAASDKKLDQNFYVRQDGTMSYFFSLEDLKSRFQQVGFETQSIEYVYRKTQNRKLELCVDRIFAQAKFQKQL